VKPLLYYRDNKYLIFASELKAILQHPAVKAEIDLFALSDYLSLGYVLAPKSIIRNIRKLPPATRLILKDGSLRMNRYWDLATLVNQDPSQITLEGAIEKLHAELDRAIRTQLISDVPLGAFLSGGIDSSTVVAKMVALSSERVSTFGIGFSEKSFNELPYSRIVAQHLGTQHFDEVIAPEIEALMPKLSWFLDEPFSDTSSVPTFLLCQMVRKKVKVALSGDGGDECFAGYTTYLADKMQSIYRHVPFLIHRMIVAPLVSRIRSTHQKVSWDFKIKQFMKYAHASPEKAHYSWRLMFSDEEKQLLLDRDINRELSGYNPFETFLEYYREVPKATPLNRSLYVDVKTWLADAMLVKVDRTSMASGLEVRVPLLDYKLVEFAFSLPSRFKLRHFKPKAILKKAMEDFLPRSIVHRRKQGFNAPVGHWMERFSEPMSQFKCSILPGQRLMWSNLMKEHKAHRAENGFKLWTLLHWSLWNQAIMQPQRTHSR
jgi:asparagine synthase (glutamine-hydrolysing)